jgi:hypothetical protein
MVGRGTRNKELRVFLRGKFLRGAWNAVFRGENAVFERISGDLEGAFRVDSPSFRQVPPSSVVVCGREEAVTRKGRTKGVWGVGMAFPPRFFVFIQYTVLLPNVQ